MTSIGAPAGWRAGQLGDFIELKRGYDLPSRERRDGPFAIVSSSGPSGTHVEAKAKGPGVVTGRYGTIGQVFFVVGDYWPLNTALYVRDFKGSDPRFVSYFLRSIDFHKYVDKAAVPGVNRNHVHMEEVTFPPLDEQRRIAAVLGALDDKIELNRKMNRTLDELAQALFKSWFIDFDRHDDLVDSEIGPVPRGWEVRSLGDVTEITMGQSPPGSTYNGDGDGLPFFQGATDFGSVFPTNRVYCTAPTQLAEEWDVLMSVRAPVGRTNLALERCAIGRGVASVRSQGGRHPAYAWCLVNSLSAALDVYNGEGTVFGSINKKALHALPVARPPADRVMAFDALAGPLLSRLRVGEEEARTLASLRDTLLPKLISGELRVPEAEELVEAAS